MKKFNFLLLPLLFLGASIHAMEMEMKTKSKLCEFFNIDEKWCEFPLDIQRLIVQKAISTFPETLPEITFTRPLSQLMLHRDEVRRLFYLREGKKWNCSRQGVTALLIINGGKKLVSASADGRIAFWELPSLRLLAQYQVSDVTQKENNEVIEVLKRDLTHLSTINAWSALTPEEQDTITPPELKERLRDVAYKPCLIAINDQESLLAVTIERTLQIYEFGSFKKLQECDIVQPVTLISFLDAYRILICDGQGIVIWDTKSGVRETISGLKCPDAILSPDKTRLAAVGYTQILLFDLSQPGVAPENLLNDEADAADIYLKLMAFFDNERILISHRQQLFLVDLHPAKEHERPCSFKGPFTILTRDELSKKVLEFRREEDIRFEMEKQNKGVQKDASETIRYQHADFDSFNQRLLLARTQRIAQLYNTRTGKKIASFIDPHCEPDSDDPCLSIKNCLLHPSLSLCFSLRSMKKHEEYHPLAVWQHLPDILTIKQWLFIRYIALLKAHGQKNCRLISFPPDWKTELTKIFRTFDIDTQRFLISAFFS